MFQQFLANDGWLEIVNVKIRRYPNDSIDMIVEFCGKCDRYLGLRGDELHETLKQHIANSTIPTRITEGK